MLSVTVAGYGSFVAFSSEPACLHTRPRCKHGEYDLCWSPSLYRNYPRRTISTGQSWVSGWVRGGKKFPNPKSVPHVFYPSCAQDRGREACPAPRLVVACAKDIVLTAT